MSRNNLCLLKFIKIPTILVYSSQHINILYIDNISYPTDPSIIQTLEINYCKVLTTLTSLSWNYLISSALQACSTRRGPQIKFIGRTDWRMWRNGWGPRIYLKRPCVLPSFSHCVIKTWWWLAACARFLELSWLVWGWLIKTELWSLADIILVFTHGSTRRTSRLSVTRISFSFSRWKVGQAIIFENLPSGSRLVSAE